MRWEEIVEMKDARIRELEEQLASRWASCGLAGHYRAERRRAERQRLQAEVAELRRQDEARESISRDRRRWMMAANRFTWAHERGCPRRTSDKPCSCGLHEFMSQPRPVIESYEENIQRLREALENALPHLQEYLEESRDDQGRRLGMDELRAVIRDVEAALAGGKESDAGRTAGSPAPASE